MKGCVVELPSPAVMVGPLCATKTETETGCGSGLLMTDTSSPRQPVLPQPQPDQQA